MEIGDQPVYKSSRLKSVVWNDFDRVKRGEVMVAICRHCKKKLSASSTSGTSHLKNHLNRCKKKSNLDTPQQLVLVRGKQKDGGVGNFTFDQEPRFEQGQNRLGSMFDQERSRFDLARMIILHEYPLSIVEHVGFKRFVENLQPSFRLMSSDSVKSDCIQIYEKEKNKVYDLLDKLPGRISLTAEMWNLYQDHGFLCLTAHYFDETLLLQKKVLNFVRIESHSEQALAEAIISSITDWDIHQKLFSVTFDNFSTDHSVGKIRDRLSQSGLLLNNGRLFHVRCATQIVNLIVQDMLEGFHEVTHKVRECVRYVKSSEQKFSEIAQQVVGNTRSSLCIDSPLQWNSTYLMLESALKYKDAFSHFQECHPDDPVPIAPSDLDWERVRTISNYLKLFIEVTNTFSSMKYPTANLYFPEFCDIHLQLIEWCKCSDFCISSVALKMKSRFDTYWSTCSLVLAIAAILDPRFKMKLVEYYYPQIYHAHASDNIKDVENGIKDLFHEYSMRLSSVDQSLGSEVHSNGLNGSLSSCSNDRLKGFDEFLQETSDNHQIKTELDKYLEEPVFPRNVDFNILNWWKVNAPKYPILSSMARDVLGIPMCTVPPDLAFSTTGRVLDPYRSSLSPDILQALICTNHWLRSELEVFEPAPTYSTSPLCIAAD